MSSSSSTADMSDSSTRRGKSTSYKARLTSMASVKNEADSAKKAMREEKESLIRVGNEALLTIGQILSDLQRTIAARASDEWCVNEEGNPVIPQGTQLQQNNVLGADLRNIWIGVKVLQRIIDGQDRSIEQLIAHADELAESIRPSSLLRHRSLLAAEVPLGINHESFHFLNISTQTQKGKASEIITPLSSSVREEIDEDEEAVYSDPPQYETTPMGAPVSRASDAARPLQTPRFDMSMLPN
jgi:hypothetical protein